MRTLRVLDFECSGLQPPEAEVCEVGIVDVTETPSGEDWVVRQIQDWLCGVSAMPPQAQAVHHISMRDLDGATPFDPDEVIVGLPEVIVAHNADYEKQFMGDVFPGEWICTYKCALRVWPEAPDHKNGTLRYWLEDQGLLSLDHDKAMPPHRAGPDAYVTAHILLALLKVATVEQMIEWTLEPRLLPKMPLGKWKGYTWDKIDWSYLDWVVKKSDLDEDMKWNARREMERRVSAVAEPPY